MKKNLLRAIALIFAIAAAAVALSGCLMMGGQMPQVTNDEAEPSVEYAKRKLIFVQNAPAAQVNVDTPLGFFCYEDNQFRILTENSKTDAHDDSISYTVTVYNGKKNEQGTNIAKENEDYTCSIKENGYLYLNSKVLGEVEIEAKCANGSSIKVVDYEIAPHTVKLFDVLIGAMGLYLIFSAIVGKGKLFQNDFIKEGMEKKHHTIVRVTSLIIGLLMLASVAIAIFDKYGKYRTVILIIFGVVIAAFIVSTILLRRCTDNEAKRKAQNDRYAGAPLKNPSAAFVFDENEPTVDDLKDSGNKD